MRSIIMNTMFMWGKLPDRHSLNIVSKSSVDLKKFENRSLIMLHSLKTEYKNNFERTKILQKGFSTHKDWQQKY